MVKYKTTIRQFGIISGIRRDTSDRLTLVTPGSLFSPESRKGQLLIMTEPTDEYSRGRDACQLVAKTISKEFYADRSFSVTTSLRKALREANSALYQYNFRAPPHQKTAVGVSCAVLRGGDLYLAQVQPTQAYIAHTGRLRALPTHPTWNPANIGVTPFLPPNALGTSLFTEPDLRRNPLSPGDTLVFCSTNLSRLLGREEAERLFCYGDAASALEALHSLCQQNSLPEACATVVELLPLLSSEARSAPLSATGVGERSKVAVKSLGGWLAGLTGDAALLLRGSGQEHEQTTHASPAANGETGGAAEVEPEPGAATSSAQETAAPSRQALAAEQDSAQPAAWPESHEEEPLPASALLGERIAQKPQKPQKRAPLDLSDHVPLPLDFAAIPKKQPLPPPTLRERALMPFRALLGIFVTLFARLLRRNRRLAPPQQPRFQTESGGLSYRRKRQPLPWIPILLLAASIVLAVLYGRLRFIETRQHDANQALDQAAQALDAAEIASTDSEALEQLQHLQVALDEARDTGIVTKTDTKRWPQYLSLRDKAKALESAILRLSPLEDLQTVASLPLSDTVSKIAVDPESGEIYALGEQSHIIYQIDPQSGRVQEFFKEGTRAHQIAASAPQTFVWRLTAIVPIDRRIDSTTAYIYNPEDPNNWFYNTLQGIQAWQRETIDVESFGGNLYIWGAQSGQILKYVSGQYASPPSAWVTDPGGQELSEAIDMAVDGQIYLLFPSGRMAVLQQGALKEQLAEPELQPEPGIITRLFASGETSDTGHLYLLEPDAERIIQLSKTGEFIQQLKAPPTGSPLKKLRDLYVIERPRQPAAIYLANGNKILRASIPPPPKRRAPPERSPTATPTATPTVSP